jgi:hypothetical protein
MKNELPCCPVCFRNNNVRPWSVGLVGHYPATIDYECSACGKVFKPPPVKSGYLDMEGKS